MSLRNSLLKPIAIFRKIVSTIKSRSRLQGYKKYLIRNHEYKDKYKGKRCFVIGNGPSLKELNLSPLRHEYTFSVNSFITTKEYNVVLPKFHVMVDSTRFDESSKVFNQNLMDFAKEKYKPVCIFPVRFIDYFKKYEYDKVFETIYIYPGLKIDKITQIDLTKDVPPYQNVINVALYVALYMGFDEIYLIGCDMTGLVHVYDHKGNIDYGGHFYDEQNRDEKTVMDNLHKGRSNEFMLKAYGYVFELFRLTNDYAVRKGVKIYNATEGGTLDIFPRVKYEDVIKLKS